MRQTGWETRLHAWVEQARARPYRLGEWDCAIFAAGAVEAVTGKNPKRLAGLYGSKRAAARLIARHGGSLTVAVSATLGVAAMRPAQARRGDILLRTEDAAEHLGVCLGALGATLNEAGLQFRELADFELAWPIGRAGQRL